MKDNTNPEVIIVHSEGNHNSEQFVSVESKVMLLAGLKIGFNAGLTVTDLLLLLC